MTDITREIQIAFVGDEGVGKTSIIMRIDQQEFQDDLSHSCGCTFTPINLKFNHDNSIETIEITNCDIVWDGNDRKDNFLDKVFQDSSAFAIVFDPSNVLFDNEDLENWLNPIKEKAPHAIIALVRNKSDLTANGRFNEDSLKKLANEYDAMYFITSAQKNEGIIELYEGLINKITGLNGNLELIKENENEKTESINIENESKAKIIIKRKKRWCCC